MPAEEVIRQLVQERVDTEANDADRDHPGDDLVGPEELAGLQNPIAEAAVDGDHLGHDDDDERNAVADADAGQDVGRGGGKDDAPEHDRPLCPEVLRRPHVDGVDVPHARDGVEDREERPEADQEEGRRIAQSEPEDRQRDEGDGRDGAEDLDQRVHQPIDGVADPHQKTQSQSQSAADEEADEDAEETGCCVVEKLARDEPRKVRPLRRVVGLERLQVGPPADDDLRRRREDERVDYPRAREPLPERENNERDEDRLEKALPRGARARGHHFAPSSFLALWRKSSLTQSLAIGGFAIFPTPTFCMKSVVTCTCSTVMSYVKAAFDIASLYSSAVSCPLNMFSRTYFSASAGFARNLFVASTKHFRTRAATSGFSTYIFDVMTSARTGSPIGVS